MNKQTSICTEATRDTLLANLKAVDELVKAFFYERMIS
jgi:hypothetical protein